MAASRLALYAHPFSSYCQKALTALYELDLAFDYKLLDGSEPAASEFAALWPIGKFPVLTDSDRTIVEASAIIEYLDVGAGGGRLIPADPAVAMEVRMLDRIFDNYVMTPVQTIVGDALRPEGAHDPHGVAAARAMLDRSYRWLDARLPGEGWAAGGGFSLADCAAAPSLLYADWVHPIPEALGTLSAYRARLLARPSYARALDEARPYRHLFPLGAPVDRD